MDYAPIASGKAVYANTGAGKNKAVKDEARFWKEFKTTTFIKNYAAVTDLYFSPTAPHRFAVSSGSRVQIYTPRTVKVVKTVSRFKETARSGHIRHDGKLLVAGDDAGSVQVFDLASRAILRAIGDHDQPVHTTLFSPASASASPQILTSSDDGTVRTFDLATAEPLSTFSDHADYVRTASFVPSNSNLYLSGSYDGTVKLWDSRDTTTSTMTFDHGYPVEKVLIHPSGTMAVSAGGPLVKIWDLVAGSSRPLKALSNHQKTVTSLCWGDHTDYSKLMSAGLDGLVKVYQVTGGQWKVGHTMRYGGQILSMALSPNDSTLVVGSADGTLSVRSKPSIPVTTVKSRASKKIAAAKAKEGTTILSDKAIERPLEITYRSSTAQTRRKLPKLKEWDRLLRVFRFADALDAVLDQPSVNPKIVVEVLNELKKMNSLKQALGGRNDRDLLRIVKFCTKQVTDPRWGDQVAEYLQVVIDLYERVLGQSPVIDQAFQSLSMKIKEEMKFQADLARIYGGLTMVFQYSRLTKVSSTSSGSGTALL